MRYLLAAAFAVTLTGTAIAATSEPIPAPALAPVTVEWAFYCDPQLDMSNVYAREACAGKTGQTVKVERDINEHDALRGEDAPYPGDPAP